MAVKRCPKCGSDTIMAKVIYGATVQSLEDGTFKIIQQGKKFEVEPVQCMRCKSLFDNGMNDLVEMQLCKTCGKPSLDIDENGECDICRTMKTRPELANMTTDDLIRMVLQLEKKNAVAVQPVADITVASEVPSEPMNPPVEESAPVAETNTAAEKVAAAQQAIAQAQAGTPVEEPAQPKKRRVSKKKSVEENTEENAEVNTETTEQHTEEAPAAPLNDVDPFSANTTGFSMFDQPAETPESPVPDMPMPMFEEEQAF